jgi:PhnB protein
MPGPDGKIAHAELDLGDSILMLADQFPDTTVKTPKELGGKTSSLLFYTEDVDATVQKAVHAGAELAGAPEDMFWGDRFAKVIDPFGHEWQVATHVEDLTPEEMEERSKQATAAMS